MFLSWDEPTIVDVKSIGFLLTRLVFDIDDLSYLLEDLKDSSSAADVKVSEASMPERSSKSAKQLKGLVGAKPDATRWAQFAAAFVVLWDRGELNIPSEAAIHKKVANYLMERGHENAFGVDHVASFIRRVKAWSANLPFTDDYEA